MMYLDIQYNLTTLYPDDNVDGNYMSVSYHRNGNPIKSQWTISIEEEFESFKISRQQNWHNEKRGWGLHPTEPFSMIGRLINGKNVMIARFQEMSPNGQNVEDIWHGYPADIRGKTNDIPTVDVLKSWLANGYINGSQFSKIRRGIL